MFQAQHPPGSITRKHISLTLELDLPCISIRLKGLVPSASLREVHQQALRGLASGTGNHEPRNQLLCDLSGLEVFAYPDQQWFIRQWLPQSARAGFRAIVLVMPLRTVSRPEARSVTVIMKVHGVNVLVTGEFARARQWLESQGQATKQQ